MRSLFSDRFDLPAFVLGGTTALPELGARCPERTADGAPFGAAVWIIARKFILPGNPPVPCAELLTKAEGIRYATVPPSRTEQGPDEWLGVVLPAIAQLPRFKVS